MANKRHLQMLKSSSELSWNKWREENAETKPDLSGADLSNAHLFHFNLSGSLFGGANLSGAYLRRTDLSKSDFRGAKLIGSDLMEANLSGAELSNADLSYAAVGWTMLLNNDLSVVKGLSTIVHRGPSTISIDTLYKSGGEIPADFLDGCGVPDGLITFIPSIVGANQAIRFYSCFISYNHKDEAFVQRLYSRMRDAGISVWFAPEDIKGGEKLYDQIDSAIQIHDRLLIVLSKKSLQSEWVMTEIRRARKTEVREKRRKLFPIRLVDMNVIQNWECFDADSGKDLAVEIREYFIPDFSDWKNNDAFETAFARLVRDLRAAEPTE